MSKTFTHPILNRHTDLCENFWSNWPRYYIVDDKTWDEPYDSWWNQNIRNEFELLALWFIDNKQEDWIDKAFREYELLNWYKLDRSYHKEFRQAILKHLPK